MSKEEKMMILQMVSDGKITPEQGAELLRAIGESKPEAPPAPKAAPGPVPAPAPSSPKLTVTSKEGPKTAEEISQSIQKTVEAATRRAEEFAQKAASSAEEWASKFSRHAEEIAQRASSEGENIGKVLGESGANLGKVLGESGENIGKMIARIFSGGFSGGPEHEFHEEVRGELPPEGEIQVNLSTTNGRITVDTWDEKGFRLDVRKRVNAASEEEAKEATKDGFEFTADGLSLTGRTKETGMNLLRNYSIGFTLTLPRDRKATLNLASSNGRITVGGVSGTRLHASTSNGRVEAEGCNFESTELGSANGRIEFEGHPGNLVAGTANGRITARISGLGDWKLNSANGRIEVEVKKEPGAAYAVEASTVMGKIDVSGWENAEVLVDETRQKMGARRYHAQTIGFGDAARKASLRASTTMGRVTVTF
ncbi:MAG: SHOCT-like domain-containing protein [Bacillota bacterium]